MFSDGKWVRVREEQALGTAVHAACPKSGCFTWLGLSGAVLELAIFGLPLWAWVFCSQAQKYDTS